MPKRRSDRFSPVLLNFCSTIQSNIRLSFDFEPDFVAGNLRALSNFSVGLCLRQKKVFGRAGRKGAAGRSRQLLGIGTT